MEKVAGFFLISCQINEIELKELLLRRYHSLCLDMETEEFIEFVNLAIENEKKDKAEKLYLALIPTITKYKKFMTFEEFYSIVSGENWDFRPAEEILKESEEIEKRLLGNGS